MQWYSFWERKMNIMISVIMSTYNESEQEITEAISSILLQTIRNIEFIIINDNPDNIKLGYILDKFCHQDSRVKIINNIRNIGLAESLNIGLASAKGDFIARMDADDISLPTRFESQLNYLLKHPECDVVCTNRVDIDINSRELGTCTSFNISDEHLEDILPLGSVINHPTVMMRRKIFKTLAGYRNFLAAQDYDLWLRTISKGYHIHLMQEKLLRYRMRENSVTKMNFAIQYCSSIYAVKMYKERLCNGGEDTYSDANYAFYMEKNRMNDVRYVQKVNKLYMKMHEAKKNRQLIRLIKCIIISFFNPMIIRIVHRNQKFKRALKRINEQEGN